MLDRRRERRRQGNRLAADPRDREPGPRIRSSRSTARRSPRHCSRASCSGTPAAASPGAYRDRAGVLEMAHRGTVFMDEIGETSPRMQSLLLRFLESGEIQRVGTTKTNARVDVRVIAATNRDLLQAVVAKTFREDLYLSLQRHPPRGPAAARPRRGHPAAPRSLRRSFFCGVLDTGDLRSRPRPGPSCYDITGLGTSVS